LRALFDRLRFEAALEAFTRVTPTEWAVDWPARSYARAVTE
jgi:hypothetical protein